MISSSRGNVPGVAVIGMSGQFPGGATDLDIFWKNQIEARDCIGFIPEHRLKLLGESQPGEWDGSVPAHQRGGFLTSVDTFDAKFFRISRAEAEAMDPQQRKLLELTWSVIESAGYNPTSWTGKGIGLFVGVHNVDYLELLTRRPGLLQAYGGYLDAGLHVSLTANRVSRWFDFQGPSEIVNTACSSGLVAVHHAFEAICRGDCPLAIAAGINLILGSRVNAASKQAGMLAADGRCKTFSCDADGFVRAEGFGAVVLKPYQQALHDGDTIHGVIRGATVHHEGRSFSLGAPSVTGQKRLIENAYVRARLPIETVSYIETHGTGTPLGDPIEVQALKEAFRTLAPAMPAATCGLGSVKTNIGHCESAAGIAGLLKVLLALKHRTLPQLLHFTRLNPRISLESTPFYVVERTQPWQPLSGLDGTDGPRRAGVSSFGFGGVIAHVIVEEHIPLQPSQRPGSTQRVPALFVLSARNRERLNAQAGRLLAALNSETLSDADLLNIAYTLQVGRDTMDSRLAFGATSLAELREKLRLFVEGHRVLPDAFLGEGKPESDVQSRERTASGTEADVLQAWTNGARIEWSSLYRDASVRRIPLPTYAFVEDRYWFKETIGQEHAESRQS